jgi:hypothetical protein
MSEQDDTRGHKLLADLSKAVRERAAPDGEPLLNRKGLEKIETLAKLFTSADAPPGLRLARDAQDRFKLTRDGRAAHVSVAWKREVGAIELGGERAGKTSRAILYVWDEPAAWWRRLDGVSELYDDLMVVLTEFLYPEAKRER